MFPRFLAAFSYEAGEVIAWERKPDDFFAPAAMAAGTYEQRLRAKCNILFPAGKLLADADGFSTRISSALSGRLRE